MMNTFDKNKSMPENEVVFVPIGKITKQTADEFLFRFDVKVNHDPGQFFQCSRLGEGESAISICSYDKDYLELSIRTVGNVTKALCELKVGDKVGLRGPYGHGYEMDLFKGKDLIIIGGGSGVAPVRGILEFVMKNRGDFGKVSAFFGFRGEKDVLFGEDFKKWEGKDISVEIALCEKCLLETKATVGFVTDILGDVQANENTVAFLCGPPIMIVNTVKMLLGKGFTKSQIYVSEERHMKCGVGRCGHCMIGGKYCCTDGPVFRYDEIY